MSDQAGRPRTAADVLADWREAERRIEDQAPGSPAWHHARLEAAALADEYHALVAAITAAAPRVGGDPSATSSRVPAHPSPVGPRGLEDA